MRWFSLILSLFPQHFKHSSKPSISHRTSHLASHKHFLKHPSDMPSRWYTVLALPFPDQRLGRRDIHSSTTFGRTGFYPSRAGYFSNPSLWDMEEVRRNQRRRPQPCHTDTRSNTSNDSSSCSDSFSTDSCCAYNNHKNENSHNFNRNTDEHFTRNQICNFTDKM